MEEASTGSLTFKLILTLVLIILNGFFVAAEFALVKMNAHKLKTLQNEGRPFADVATWLFERQNLTLSACQMGITMASLGLGWIGEPTLAAIIEPWVHKLGITSSGTIHAIAFTIAFSVITALHIVIGEQVPKIYAIRKPKPTYLWSAAPLKFFYVILYPFVVGLNWASDKILAMLGISTESHGHDGPLSEEEIRASMSIAYAKGELSRNEHELLNAVFKFDEKEVHEIMLPRGDIKFLDYNDGFSENLKLVIDNQHTRYPLVNDSLDDLIGVVHIKDLLGLGSKDDADLKKLSRSPIYIPRKMPVSLVMKEFKTTHQHFGFVVNEHGTIVGAVTMDNVTEQLVGSIQDEFDNEKALIEDLGNGVYNLAGNITITELNEKLDINLKSEDSDTLAGLLMEIMARKVKKNQKFILNDEVSGVVLEAKGLKATKVKLEIKK